MPGVVASFDKQRGTDATGANLQYLYRSCVGHHHEWAHLASYE
jgi:hypothetical protein